MHSCGNSHSPHFGFIFSLSLSHAYLLGSISHTHIYTELLPGVLTYGVSTVTGVWTGTSPPHTGAISAGKDRPTAGGVCEERGVGREGVGGRRRGRKTSTLYMCTYSLFSTVFYSCVFQLWCTLSSRKTSVNGSLSSPLKGKVPFALPSWISLSSTSFCHTGGEGERGYCKNIFDSMKLKLICKST